MAGFWDQLGQGLQGAGAVLSPQVYQEQAQERQNSIVNLANSLKVAREQRALQADDAFKKAIQGFQPGMSSSAMLEKVQGLDPSILAESPSAQGYLQTISALHQKEVAEAQKNIQLQSLINERNRPTEHYDPVSGNLVLSYPDGRTETRKVQQERFPSGGSIPPDTLRNMAEQALTGDTSVLTGLGYGTQGANNKIALRNEMTRIMTERKMSPQEVASKNAEFFGTKAGQRTVGTRSANIEMAVSEAQQMAPLALTASKNVSRTDYPSLNSLLLAAQKGTGDENVTRLGIATNSLINIYARAINPQGVATVSDKDHARELLAQAWSNGQYEAGIDQLMKELEAARKAPGMVREGFRGAVTGENKPQGSGWSAEKEKRYQELLKKQNGAQ